MLLACGQEIGSYRIVRALGKGGMGEVYEVEHIRLGEHFALKAFALDHGRIELLRKRFLAEGRVLAKLRHPNIARVFELDHDVLTGVSYFVMDLVLDSHGQARSLADIRPENSDTDDLRRWFGQLCSALDYIHSRGIVHRDVKPNNILIDADGNAVLSDFGISRYLDEDLRKAVGVPVGNGPSIEVTRQMILGTDAYMAPEVRLGRGAVFASDSYSLGLVFFQLLTGVWFDLHEGVFDLLKPIDGYWLEVLPILLRDSPSERPEKLVPFLDGIGVRSKHKYLPWKSVAVVIVAWCLAVVGLQTTLRRQNQMYDDANRIIDTEITALHQESEDIRRAHEEFESGRCAVETMMKRVAEAVRRRKREEEARKAALGSAIRWRREALRRIDGLLGRLDDLDDRAKRMLVQLDDMVDITYPFGEPFESVTSQIQMIWCHPGEFLMGSSASETGRFPNEVLGKVKLTKGFWLAQTEVTQGQWKALMGGETVLDLAHKSLQAQEKYGYRVGSYDHRKEGEESSDDYNVEICVNANDDPRKWCGDVDNSFPVYHVSWEQAKEFCKKLTELERDFIPKGYEYRLPTEAEWEYACRAGSTTELPGGRTMAIKGENNAPELHRYAWYGGNSSWRWEGRGFPTSDWKEKQYPGGWAVPREVATRERNDWGFYDMLGNVIELCHDLYGQRDGGEQTDPHGPDYGRAHVAKGGSWKTPARFCRPAYRDGYAPSVANFIGFRVALAPIIPDHKYSPK